MKRLVVAALLSLFTSCGGCGAPSSSTDASLAMETQKNTMTLQVIEDFNRTTEYRLQQIKGKVGARQTNGDCFLPECPSSMLSQCVSGSGKSSGCIGCLTEASGEACCLCPEGSQATYQGCSALKQKEVTLTPNCKTYRFPVGGDSCEALYRNMEQIPYLQGLDGWLTMAFIMPAFNLRYFYVFDPAPGPEGQICVRGSLKDLIIPLSFSVFYPEWTRSQLCPKAWEDFLHKVRMHEERHARIAQESIAELKQRLHTLSFDSRCGATQAEAESRAFEAINMSLGREWREFVQHYQTAQDDFDQYDYKRQQAEGPLMNCSLCK